MFKLITREDWEWETNRDSFFYSGGYKHYPRPMACMTGKKYMLQWQVLGRTEAIKKMRNHIPSIHSFTEGVSRIAYVNKDGVFKTINNVSNKVIPTPIKLWVPKDGQPEMAIQKMVERHFGDYDNWVSRFTPAKKQIVKHLEWETFTAVPFYDVPFDIEDFSHNFSMGRTPFTAGAAAMGKTEAAFVLHDHQKALIAHMSILSSRNRKINNHSAFGAIVKPRNQGKSTVVHPQEYARQMSNLMAFSAASTVHEQDVLERLKGLLE